MFRYLPEQASTFAAEVDTLHNLITDLSVFFTVAIFGAAVYFAIRYRRRDGQHHETPQIEGDHRLELIWTVVPTLVCIYLGFKGVVVYHDMRTPPENTNDVNVVAQQFAWTFEYENGKSSSNELVVPIDKPTRLIMRSKDVLHSFFIPAMRVKKDVVPGMYSQLWFQPLKTGTYQAFCTEYCGANHSGMLAKVKVVSSAEYARWLNDNSDEIMKSRMNPTEVGKVLYKKQNCYTCHSLDGSRVVGPSFKGLWGREEQLEGGATVKVDENYIQNSILNPAAQIVAGYSNLMPAYEGTLTNEDVTSLIAFIKNLDSLDLSEDEAEEEVEEISAEDLAAMTPAQRGEKIYQNNLCITCHSVDGSKVVGPTFKGLYNRKGKLADGSEYVADDAYIKNSVLNPMAEVVEGYPPAMPSFQGQLNDDQIADVIEYIKTLQ